MFRSVTDVQVTTRRERMLEPFEYLAAQFDSFINRVLGTLYAGVSPER